MSRAAVDSEAQLDLGDVKPRVGQLVALQVKLANQDGDVVVNATAEVELPLV